MEFWAPKSWFLQSDFSFDTFKECFLEFCNEWNCPSNLSLVKRIPAIFPVWLKFLRWFYNKTIFVETFQHIRSLWLRQLSVRKTIVQNGLIKKQQQTLREVLLVIHCQTVKGKSLSFRFTKQLESDLKGCHIFHFQFIETVFAEDWR